MSGALGDIDLSGIFDSLGGDIDPSQLEGLFESLGGTGGDNRTTPTDASSPLDKIKELFGGTAGGASFSSSSDAPAVTFRAVRSKDEKNVAIDVYLDHYVGASAGTLTLMNTGMSFQNVKTGTDADKIKHVKENGFTADINQSNPRQVRYGFYFNNPLQDAAAAEYVKGFEGTEPYDSEHFHLATIVFSGIQPGARLVIEARISDRRTATFSAACEVSLPAYFGDESYGAVNIVRGDVDGDGELTSGDARSALQASVQLVKFDAVSLPFWAADVNGDKQIGADDARMILRASVKLETLR